MRYHFRFILMHIFSLVGLFLAESRILLVFRFQSGKYNLSYIIAGLFAGIVVAYLFFSFYKRRLKKNIVDLQGFHFPHLLIFIMTVILRFLLFGTIWGLSELDYISINTMNIWEHYIHQIFSAFTTSCLSIAVVIELILLILWEKRNKIKLYVDFSN